MTKIYWIKFLRLTESVSWRQFGWNPSSLPTYKPQAPELKENLCIWVSCNPWLKHVTTHELLLTACNTSYTGKELMQDQCLKNDWPWDWTPGKRTAQKDQATDVHKSISWPSFSCYPCLSSAAYWNLFVGQVAEGQVLPSLIPIQAHRSH